MADGPTETIARRVSELRVLKGLTKQGLGDKLTELGVAWDRFTVGALESGKRQNVSVKEWLTLARALDVPPLTLLLPLGESGLVEILPGVTIHPDLARQWIVGEEEPTDSQQRVVGDTAFWHRQSAPLRLYGRLNVAQQEMRRVDSEVRMAERVGRPEATAAAREQHVAALRRLSDVLDAMVTAEVKIHELPGEWVDQMTELGMLTFPDRIPRSAGGSHGQ